MNSLLDNNNKYIGQYIKIDYSEHSIRVFTKLYNLSISDKKYHISIDTVRDLVNMNKYLKNDNSIYINDLKTGTTIFRPLKIGYVAFFSNITRKLYLVKEEEFDNFIDDNNYHKEITINFILGIESISDGYFKQVKVILANNLENAKNIYKNIYNIKEEPKFIGIEEDNYVYIPTDKQLISAKLDEDILID